MQNWFEGKVTYDKTKENGEIAKVTEPYLVDALSFTEAEARLIEELKPFISGEFTIADIKRARISELFFNENGDRYYQAKVAFMSLDEKTGTEKITNAKMIAQASDFDEAVLVLKKGMEGALADWKLAELKETQIMDVFPYSEEDKKKIYL